LKDDGEREKMMKSDPGFKAYVLAVIAYEDAKPLQNTPIEIEEDDANRKIVEIIELDDDEEDLSLRPSLPYVSKTSPKSLTEFLDKFSHQTICALLRTVKIETNWDVPKSDLVKILEKDIVNHGVYLSTHEDFVQQVLSLHTIDFEGKNEEERSNLYFLESLKYPNLVDFFSNLKSHVIVKQILILDDSIDFHIFDHDTLVQLLVHLIKIKGAVYIFQKLTWKGLGVLTRELGTSCPKFTPNVQHGEAAACLKILDIVFPGLYESRIDDHIYELGTRLHSMSPVAEFIKMPTHKLKHGITMDELSLYFPEQLVLWLNTRNLQVGNHEQNKLLVFDEIYKGRTQPSSTHQVKRKRIEI
jgi:hypothetical protein